MPCRSNFFNSMVLVVGHVAEKCLAVAGPGPTQASKSAVEPTIVQEVVLVSFSPGAIKAFEKWPSQAEPVIHGANDVQRSLA